MYLRGICSVGQLDIIDRCRVFIRVLTRRLGRAASYPSWPDLVRALGFRCALSTSHARALHDRRTPQRFEESCEVLVYEIIMHTVVIFVCFCGQNDNDVRAALRCGSRCRIHIYSLFNKELDTMNICREKWKALGNTSREHAMRQYIQMMDDLVRNIVHAAPLSLCFTLCLDRSISPTFVLNKRCCASLSTMQLTWTWVSLTNIAIYIYIFVGRQLAAKPFLAPFKYVNDGRPDNTRKYHHHVQARLIYMYIFIWYWKIECCPRNDKCNYVLYYVATRSGWWCRIDTNGTKCFTMHPKTYIIYRPSLCQHQKHLLYLTISRVFMFEKIFQYLIVFNVYFHIEQHEGIVWRHMRKWRQCQG